MDALEPEGLLVVVVKAGIFADDDNANWRHEFTRNHSVLGMISLPDDLFYPTAAPTSILIAKAHIQQNKSDRIFMARIWNDGFEKLKGRRVKVTGSQLQATSDAFSHFLTGVKVSAENLITIPAKNILNGNEWSPQQWLPQPIEDEERLKKYENDVRFSIYKAVTSMPELAEAVLDDFMQEWDSLADYETGKTAPVSFFFEVANGRSSGEKNHPEGVTPYISSGDQTNSIVRLVDAEVSEIFECGGITITAFGQAYVQPWPFVARGNGGSSVRVLIPKFKMTFNDLVWFASQINAQRWRIFYARMAIKSRLEQLEITSPPHRIKDKGDSIASRVKSFKNKLFEFSCTT
jgi:type I restriction enzyme M protein